MFLDDPIAAENPADTYNTQPPHTKDPEDVTNGDSKAHDTPNGIPDDITKDGMYEYLKSTYRYCVIIIRRNNKF